MLLLGDADFTFLVGFPPRYDRYFHKLFSTLQSSLSHEETSHHPPGRLARDMDKTVDVGFHLCALWEQCNEDMPVLSQFPLDMFANMMFSH